MGNKPYLHMCLASRGLHYPVISINEDKKGNIRVVIKPKRAMVMPDGSLKDIHQRYFSIHPFQISPNKTSTFKYTQETVDREILELVAASRILDTNLSVPLHGRFLPDLSAYGAAVMGSRDHVVQMADVDFSKNTFVYCMIISPAGVEAVPSRRNTAIYDGDIFRITLIWSFLHLASDRSERELLSGTSYPRWNKRTPVRADMRSIEGTDTVESLRYATILMNSLRADKCAEAAECCGHDEVARRSIMACKLHDRPLM